MEQRQYKYFMVEDVVVGVPFKTALRFSATKSLTAIKDEIGRGAGITEITEDEYYQFHTRETV